MSTRRLVLIVIAVLALAGGAGAGWIASPRIAALFNAPPPSAAEAPMPYDPLGALERNAVALLADPETDAPSGFKRLPWAKPDAFCRMLGSLGLENPIFQGGAFPTPSWTCITDLLKPAGTEEAAASSLFVTARGDDPDRLGMLRLKLNLIDPKTVPTVKGIAKDLLTRIYAGLGWTLPQEVLDAIDANREGTIDDYGVIFDLRREFGPADRYNLIISFPQRLGAGGEDRFYSTNRRPPTPPPAILQPPRGEPGSGLGDQPGAGGQPPLPEGPSSAGLPGAPAPPQIP